MIKENVMNQIWDGIIIGGAGGAIAGLTVYLVAQKYGVTPSAISRIIRNKAWKAS